jgi:uncharacterized protein YacL
MKTAYLRAIRAVFILLSVYLSYVYLRPFFPYLATRDYRLSMVCVFAVPCLLVYVESRVKEVFTQELLLGLIGLVCGLGTSALILLALPRTIPEQTETALRIGLHLLLGYFGAVVGVRSAHRLDFTTSKFIIPSEGHLWGAKFLDTSVLVDGRIFDMAQTGFLEGLFVVPTFVTEELRALADSTNHLKRSKGRRGMEILSRLQDSPQIHLEILSADPPAAEGVDKKLIVLAKQHGGTIYTVDSNLNKIAEIEQARSVNINRLYQSMKRVVLPGERLRVHVVREGKEEHQGVGYLDDGTMVVVEQGRPLIGKDVEVEVDTILQTAAGQMIFARVFNGQLEKDKHAPVIKSAGSSPHSQKPTVP